MPTETDTARSATPLNTILLWITLGVLAFIGGASVKNTISLAALQAGQVTRTELDTRIVEVKIVQTQQTLDITNLRLKVQQLESYNENRRTP